MEPSIDETSSMAFMYDSCERPRPPYSRGILIPNAPRSRRPWITASGISPSRSMRSESTCSRSSRSSFSRNGCARRTSSGSCSGYGWIRSRRNRPRNRSRTKLGAAHSCSRAASATSRASSGLTWLRSGGGAVVVVAILQSSSRAASRQQAGLEEQGDPRTTHQPPDVTVVVDIRAHEPGRDGVGGPGREHEPDPLVPEIEALLVKVEDHDHRPYHPEDRTRRSDRRSRRQRGGEE